MPISVFGGGAVQTAYVSFAALDITDNSITLVWPTSYFNVPSVVNDTHYDVLAASFTVNTGPANLNTVTLPDATESSVGSNFIVTNVGQSPFRLLRSDTTELISLPNAPDTANSYWVQLIDNSTSAGTWAFVLFGAGTSFADASALEGNGLVALFGLLNTNIAVQSILNSPYQVLVSDRAKLLLWQAGAGIIRLPAIGDVPSGFYTSVNNEGSGNVEIIDDLTNAPIDNRTSIIVSPGQSLSIITDGNKWWTLGFGQNIASSDFPQGSSLNPSITFLTNPRTGIYYYQAPFPPVNPPGIGFTVNSTEVGNFTNDGFLINGGRTLNLQDSTGDAFTQMISNVNYGRILWDKAGLLFPPTLTINGDNTSSKLTLGPFAEFSIIQGSTTSVVQYNGNNIIAIADTGVSLFPNLVVFQQQVTFDDVAIFNGSTFFNGSVNLTTPLSIGSGGTGEDNQQDALNAIMPPANPGDIIYFDGATSNWLPLPIGTPGQVLTVVDFGLYKAPRWVDPPP